MIPGQTHGVSGSYNPVYSKEKMKIAFDVGANNGFHTKWMTLHENCYVHSFEPINEMCNLIKQSMSGHQFTLNQVAVSNTPGVRDFKISKVWDWGVSGFHDFKSDEELNKTWPGRTDFKFCENRQVQVIRLDDYCRANNITRIDKLHIDCQGEDLNVLKSLGEMIGIVQEGVLEAPLDELGAIYVGVPVFADIARFLWRNGFEITRIEESGGTQNECDVLFRKKQ